MTILAVNNLSKAYDDVYVVDHVSFEVQSGELFGLLGPNGAGKTTLIDMLSTYIAPSFGEAFVAGHNICTEAAAVKRVMGVVPQDIALYPTLNAMENLRFFGRLYELPRDKLEPRIRELLHLTGLDEHARKPVENYSGGMKRRLNLAVGLLSEPRLLMLDEPTVGVDPQSRNTIFENIQHLSQQGLAILYTTHYMEEAEQLCDRVAIMDQGEIITFDTPKNLIKTWGTGIIRIEAMQIEEKDLTRLQTLPQVKSVTYRDNVLLFETTDPQQALLRIIGVFNETDVSMTALEILEPSLGSVFIQLTGKQLRD